MANNIEHIFVYGTLRLGQGACRTFGLETRGEYVKTAQYTGASIYHLGGFPGLKFEADYTMVGDIFKINDPELMHHLDRYEGYDANHPDQSLYLRKEIEVDGIPCYTYEYNGDPRQEARIQSGDWTKV